MKNAFRLPAPKVLLPTLIIILVLIAARIALPYILLHYVNGYLKDMQDYKGYVKDIEVHLWRGAYKLKEASIEKTTGKVPVPFFSAPSIDLFVVWHEIFRGRLVGNIVFHNPKINFVKGPTKETSQTSISKIWIDKTKGLFPFRIDRFAVEDALFHYRDFHSDPKINIALDHVYLEADNLTNSLKLNNEKFATIKIYNKPGEDDPKLNVNVSLDSFARHPTLNMKFSLKDLNLVRLNDFLRAYGNFDVQTGRFSLYADITTSEGAYKGYVKPFFSDLKFVDWKKQKHRPLKLVWEAIVGAAAKILKSEPQEKVATEIPISGNFENKDIDYWSAIANLLRNAFIQAIKPGFERQK